MTYIRTESKGPTSRTKERDKEIKNELPN